MARDVDLELYSRHRYEDGFVLEKFVDPDREFYAEAWHFSPEVADTIFHLIETEGLLETPAIEFPVQEDQLAVASEFALIESYLKERNVVYPYIAIDIQYLQDDGRKTMIYTYYLDEVRLYQELMK